MNKFAALLVNNNLRCLFAGLVNTTAAHAPRRNENDGVQWSAELPARWVVAPLLHAPQQGQHLSE